MSIRNKVIQSSRFSDTAKTRTLSRHANLFDEITSAVRAIAFADSPYSANIDTDPDVFIHADATAGAVSVVLPIASKIPGRQFWIKKMDASANLVTIAAQGSETLEGAASYILAAQFDSIHVISDGTNWFIHGSGSVAAPTVAAFANVAARPVASVTWRGRWIYLIAEQLMQVCVDRDGGFVWEDGPGGGDL